ncbi:hypothetical protein LEMA_P041280.1 [Plenodomus lingam JN3]|uniref:Uncharacterized protein n=1 Tax=Leptosphaeria maculans (strain JN3 / isolate v23.1.3 / race Av1-4-5-6-7-8) TaxID=985895 RepID=E4ZPK2_LEPMJ|nr:hypothetical protein LEMA_P041280.1 [Plenodomus lingam JN3]CBX93227.1 hypothetical protein LEMA_P041280.1 [Plenodomus lingam JN3]
MIICCDTSIICHDLHLNRGFILTPGNHPTPRLELLDGWQQHAWGCCYFESSSGPTQIPSQRYLHVRHTKSPLLLHSFRAPLATYPPRLLLQQVLRGQTAYHRDIHGHETIVAVFRIERQRTPPRSGCRKCP